MILKIGNVGKTFGKNRVLNDVSITLKPGIYGLLGPNGAGKTTLMRILTTILNEDSGNITYGNLNWNNKNDVRKIIGYLPQRFSLYKNLTVVQALEHIGVLKGIKKDIRGEVVNIIRKVNLIDHKDKKIGQLSGGMVRRVGIAQAILGDPKIIIVDEPTAGLDPEERMRFRNLIKELNGDNIIIISTHIVEDVQMICENVAIMDRGKIILEGDVEKIKDTAKGAVWELEISDKEFPALQEKVKITQQHRTDTGYNLRVIASQKPNESAVEVYPTLEEVYLNALG